MLKLLNALDEFTCELLVMLVEPRINAATIATLERIATTHDAGSRPLRPRSRADRTRASGLVALLHNGAHVPRARLTVTEPLAESFHAGLLNAALATAPAP